MYLIKLEGDTQHKYLVQEENHIKDFHTIFMAIFIFITKGSFLVFNIQQKPSPFTTSHKTSTAKSLASKPTSSAAKTNTSSVSKTSSASQPGLSVTPSGGDGWTESGWDDSSGWDDGEDQWQSPGDDPGLLNSQIFLRKS